MGKRHARSSISVVGGVSCRLNICLFKVTVTSTTSAFWHYGDCGCLSRWHGLSTIYCAFIVVNKVQESRKNIDQPIKMKRFKDRFQLLTTNKVKGRKNAK